MIKKTLNKVSLEDLEKFLNKIDQLNNLVGLINKCPEKKKKLSECCNHDDVIKLTKSWGFDIGKRWGE